MGEGAILLVEDNPDDQELTLRALRKHNVRNQVVVVEDGVEALDYLFGTGEWAGADPPEPPELILLDLNLPRLSGLEVLSRLRAHPRTRLCPVVVLTSSVEQRDLLESYNQGANSYVQKPVDFVEFVQAVRRLGIYWLLLNRQPERGAP